MAKKKDGKKSPNKSKSPNKYDSADDMPPSTSELAKAKAKAKSIDEGDVEPKQSKGLGKLDVAQVESDGDVIIRLENDEQVRAAETSAGSCGARISHYMIWRTVFSRATRRAASTIQRLRGDSARDLRAGEGQMRRSPTTYHRFKEASAC